MQATTRDQAATRRRMRAYQDGHADGYAGFAPHAGYWVYSNDAATQTAYTAGYECGEQDRHLEAPGWTLDIECAAWVDARAEEE